MVIRDLTGQDGWTTITRAALTPNTQLTDTFGLTPVSYFNMSSRKGIRLSNNLDFWLDSERRGISVALNSCRTLCSSVEGMGSAGGHQPMRSSDGYLKRCGVVERKPFTEQTQSLNCTRRR